MYTIGEISKMFNLPISTLRYYDKMGLFPTLKRHSGIREFSTKEIETLRVIECLKKSGLSMKDIQQFMNWCVEGPSTFVKRKELFENQKAAVEEEIRSLNRALDMLKYKCWFYEQILLVGDEEKIRSLVPEHLPKEIREIYENAHRE